MKKQSIKKTARKSLGLFLKRPIPFKRGSLVRKGKKVTHYISYQVYGNPKGNKWLFCHGGPGFHSVPESNLKNFDLKRDMVILMDQRGCGSSTPTLELRENTTAHLIDDIRALLNILEIKKVNILGSSWGTTVALAFAIEYPEQVNSLVLKSVFLGRKKDIVSPYLPNKKWTENQKEKYDLTLGVLKEKFKIKNWFKDGLKILKSSNEDSSFFSKYWTGYEELICAKRWTLLQHDEDYQQLSKSIAMMELHYFNNDCFLPSNYILGNAKKLKNTNVHIIHGGDDMVCGVNQALELHRILPKSQLFIDKSGGHFGTKKMNQKALKSVSQLGKIKS